MLNLWVQQPNVLILYINFGNTHDALKKNTYFLSDLTSLLPLLIVLHSSLPLSSRIIRVDVVFCVIFMHAAI